VLLDERLAIPHQLSDLTNLQRWDETGPQQTVPQQVSQPLTIFGIGLPARHGFDVMGVNEHHLQHAFQNVEDRLPVHTCALYRHVRAALRHEPVRESQQLIRHRREGACLLASLLDQTGNHRPGMYVEATATSVDNLHHVLRCMGTGVRTFCSKESVMRAHPRGAATVGGACQGSPVRLTNGLAAPGCFDLLSADDRGKDTLTQSHFHPGWRTTVHDG